jgi:hypothetical protein
MTAIVLSGELQPSPPSLGVRILQFFIIVRVVLLLIPWFAIGGGLILVGLMALGPRRKDFPELWICLPAGLALLAVFIGVPLWLWRKLPIWVQHFEYDGHVLSYTVAAGRPVESRSVADIVEMSGFYQRGRGLVGYRIKFREEKAIIVSRQVANADQLYAALQQAVRAAIIP